MKRLLVVFVDALGPEQLERFGPEVTRLPSRRALRGILGYSSGALATVLTGAAPAEHGRMCLFSRASQASILSPLRWLGLLPAIVHERAWLRRKLGQALSRAHDLRGYVALHRVPPSAFSGLDLPEREDLFAAERIGEAPTFLARAREAGLDVAVTPWQLPEEARWQHLDTMLARRAPALTFAYAAGLDGALHEEGDDGPKAKKARARITEGIARARDRLSRHGDVATLIVGDHGMAPVHRVIDPRPFVYALGEGALFVDSTMLRVWGDERRLHLLRRFAEQHGGSFLGRPELEARAAPTRGAPYGDALWLLPEGAIFAPSWVGGRANGMHGYDLDSRSSRAAMASDLSLDGVQTLEDVAPLVQRALGLS